jgi:hypothetical protein
MYLGCTLLCFLVKLDYLYKKIWQKGFKWLVPVGIVKSQLVDV